jgi:hypothetical protein
MSEIHAKFGNDLSASLPFASRLIVRELPGRIDSGGGPFLVIRRTTNEGSFRWMQIFIEE